MTIPLWILAGLALVAGFTNLPAGFAPDSLELTLRALRRAHRSPSREVEHPEFSFGAGRSVDRPRPGRRSCSAGSTTSRGRGPPRPHRAQRAGRRGLPVPREQVLPRLTSTRTSSSGRIKGPIARAAYWFNQHVIDGVSTAPRPGSKWLGRLALQVHRPGHRRPGRQRVRRRGRGLGPAPAPHPDRPGPAVRRPPLRRRRGPRRHLHHHHLEEPRPTWTDFLDGWGLTLADVPARGGRGPDAGDPQAAGDVAQGRRAPGHAGHRGGGRAPDARLRLRPRRRAAVRGRQELDRRHQQPATSSASTASPCR